MSSASTRSCPQAPPQVPLGKDRNTDTVSLGPPGTQEPPELPGTRAWPGENGRALAGAAPRLATGRPPAWSGEGNEATRRGCSARPEPRSPSHRDSDSSLPDSLGEFLSLPTADGRGLSHPRCIPPTEVTGEGTSLIVQWSGLGDSTTKGPGSIPGRGSKIPQAETKHYETPRCMGFALNSSRQGDEYVGMTYMSLSLFVFGPLSLALTRDQTQVLGRASGESQTLGLQGISESLLE